MTIIEAISSIDELKPNSYTPSQKIGWLSKLDGLIKTTVIDTHEGGEDIAFSGYTDDTSMEQELLVPAPHDGMYTKWLEAQIDYHNGEYSKYNNSVSMYQAEYESFKNHYHQTHMPKGKSIKYF